MREEGHKEPLVSIITPSYNQGKFIEETIVSVLSQAGDFFLEYIIMDGGSTDDSVETIRKYDRLIRGGEWPVACRGITYRWTSERDKGQADAVNKGFAAAHGDILGWLNSDDTYLPGAVEKARTHLSTASKSVMVYGNAYYTSRSGDVIGRYASEAFSLASLAQRCFICQPTVFIRSELFAQVGALDIDLHASMYYDFWIRIGKRFEERVVFSQTYLATSRMYPENKTMSGRRRIHEENFLLMNRYFGYVDGEHILSCLYDIYRTAVTVSFINAMRQFSFGLFMIPSLLNGKTLKSLVCYLWRDRERLLRRG